MSKEIASRYDGVLSALFHFQWQCELCHSAISCVNVWRQIVHFQLLSKDLGVNHHQKTIPFIRCKK